MIYLFWVIPFLISVWVGAITKRQEDDVASMVSIQYGLVMSFVGFFNKTLDLAST